MYVAISDKLIGSVCNQITNMRYAELSTYDNAEQIELPNGDDPLAVRLMWGEHADLRAIIPENFLPMISRFNVIVCQEPEHEGVEERWELYVSLKQPAPGPVKLTAYREQLKVHLKDYPEFNEVVRKINLRKECEHRWKKVASQVTDFLGNCKSLNEAVKLLPSIKVYIPQGYLERLEEKAQRAQKKESEAANMLDKVDSDLLTSSAVLSRLAAQRT